MGSAKQLQPALRERALRMASGLSGEEREALLVKCWMSHDARWFMAVTAECGLETANRLNKIAAHEAGKAEARRIARALQLPPVRSVDDYLVVQELLISLLGPHLLDYGITSAGDNAFQINVERCFAHEQVVRAGVAETYECGIFPRVTGWLEVLGVEYEMTPSLGRCLKAQGQECTYVFRFKGTLPSPGVPEESTRGLW
jgi:hypothetical protein